MLLVENTFLLLNFCVSFYNSQALPSVEKVENRHKLHLVSNFTCTHEELNDFTSKIESIHGEIKSLDSYIKSGGVIHVPERFGNGQDFYLTQGGPGVWVDFAREGSKVSFRYVFHPNKERVKDQCKFVKAYKLKFNRIIATYNKLKPVVEKAKNFDMTNKYGYIKKRFLNNEKVYFTFKDTDSEGMEPQKKFCTKKVFNNPVFPQKVESDSQVETFFRKPWFKSWNGTDPEEYLKDFYRSPINCYYLNDYTHWSDQGYAVAEGRRVRVDYSSQLYFYNKELSDFTYLNWEEN